MKRKRSHRKLRLCRYSKRRIANREAEFRRTQRANWSELVPEMAFVLLKCKAIWERSPIDDIAAKAAATYPASFETNFDRRRIPDLALVLLTLNEAKKREWGYVAGNWFKGWRLTKKGAAFARDVQRRRDLLRQPSAAVGVLQCLAA
jgi:hypothetical protein